MYAHAVGLDDLSLIQPMLDAILTGTRPSPAECAGGQGPAVRTRVCCCTFVSNQLNNETDRHPASDRTGPYDLEGWNLRLTLDTGSRSRGRPATLARPRIRPQAKMRRRESRCRRSTCFWSRCFQRLFAASLLWVPRRGRKSRSCSAASLPAKKSRTALSPIAHRGSVGCAHTAVFGFRQARPS